MHDPDDLIPMPFPANDAADCMKACQHTATGDAEKVCILWGPSGSRLLVGALARDIYLSFSRLFGDKN